MVKNNIERNYDLCIFKDKENKTKCVFLHGKKCSRTNKTERVFEINKKGTSGWTEITESKYCPVEKDYKNRVEALLDKKQGRLF